MHPATKMAEEDITANLPSLQFEAALTPEENELLYLRARSHALTLSSCGQAAFLIAIFNGARQKILEKKCPAKKKTSKLLQEAPKRDPLLVGIIGCGRVGKQLANTLMKYSDVQPGELFISTRRPETLSALQARGVHCGFDNIKVCSTVDILFIACLPSQFDNVAKEIKGHLNCPVYILTGAIPLARIRQILEYDQLIKPEMSWSKWDKYKDSNITKWNFERDLVDILSESFFCEMTCPLRHNTSEESMVDTNSQWAELVVYAFINLCTMKEIPKNDVITICNTILLGFGPSDDMSESITVQDVEVDSHRYTLHSCRVPDIRDELYFPHFDLGLVSERQSHLGQKLTNPDGALRKMFVKRYKSVFDKFQYWKGMPTHSE